MYPSLPGEEYLYIRGRVIYKEIPSKSKPIDIQYWNVRSEKLKDSLFCERLHTESHTFSSLSDAANLTSKLTAVSTK